MHFTMHVNFCLCVTAIFMSKPTRTRTKTKLLTQHGLSESVYATVDHPVRKTQPN